MKNEVNCMGRIQSPILNSLEYLSPEAVAQLDRRPAWAPLNQTSSSEIRQSLFNGNRSLMLFRDGYSEFCFQQDVLVSGGFNDGRPLLEAGSGNNDLGYFGSLRTFMVPVWGKDNYLLSNYSGGRGDYFALTQLASVHNSEYELFSGTRPYTIDNICMTVGGQGGLSVVASFLNAAFPGSSVVVADSAYCGNYAPFCHSRVPLTFVKSEDDCSLPLVSSVIRALGQPDSKAWLYVKYHNPSGERYSNYELREIVSHLKNNDQFLIYPEAYEALHFSGAERESYLDILRICSELEFHNLIRVKTIAKEFGFSGLRAGYLLAPTVVSTYARDFNAMQIFNAPMSNSALLVACAYLRYRAFGGNEISSIESYLGAEVTSLHECHPIAEDFGRQNEELNANKQFILTELFSGQPERRGALLEDRHTAVVDAAGGINLYVRLKDMEDVDPVVFFRRAYLLTGLILHPGAFLGNKPGFWTRLTISHRRERLAECVKALKFIRSQHELFKATPVRPQPESPSLIGVVSQ